MENTVIMENSPESPKTTIMMDKSTGQKGLSVLISGILAYTAFKNLLTLLILNHWVHKCNILLTL